MTPQELLDEVLKYQSYITQGGVTATGGEPLVQSAFLRFFFRLCKEENIHTVLDTSGCIYSSQGLEVLEYTDLVLLDIKAIDPAIHKELTGALPESTFRFLDYLEEKQIPTWIRHVVVPNYTDNNTQLEKLAHYLKPYKTIQKVELLPYHTMGKNKYEQLGLKYKLDGIDALSEEHLIEARKIFQQELPDLFK